MQQNYFFIDGSALIAQISKLRKAQPQFETSRLCADRFVQYFLSGRFRELHAGEFKRAVFYFADGDQSRVERYLCPLPFEEPGSLVDIEIKFCGKKLPTNDPEWQEFYDSLKPQWRDYASRREKGVDMELGCDALRLASGSRLERLLLFANDADYIPLCRCLKEFGSNVSLVQLSDHSILNQDLRRATDSYDIVDSASLIGLFDPLPSVPPTPSSGAPE